MQVNQEMNVIGGTASGHENDLFRLAYPRNVPPKTLRVAENVHSLFGAEDAVKKGRRVCMRHFERVREAEKAYQ